MSHHKINKTKMFHFKTIKQYQVTKVMRKKTILLVNLNRKNWINIL